MVGKFWEEAAQRQDEQVRERVVTPWQNIRHSDFSRKICVERLVELKQVSWRMWCCMGTEWCPDLHRRSQRWRGFFLSEVLYNAPASFVTILQAKPIPLILLLQKGGSGLMSRREWCKRALEKSRDMILVDPPSVAWERVWDREQQEKRKHTQSKPSY